MKRSIVIICCLFVLFASTAAAWASCKQVSFTAGHHRSSSDAVPAHNHESDSHHEHSPGTVIHCPTLDQFLLTATFSATKTPRMEHVSHADVSGLVSQPGWPQSYRSLHGPPGFSRSTNIPPYLLLSVLRI